MLGVGDRPRRLLEEVRGLRLVDLPAAEECCGFGGTFAMKNADTSIAMGSDKARHVRETGAEVLVAGDNSCLMHVGGLLSRQRSGVRTMHLAEVLAATEGTAR
jgi:L-lactate dehydrogenase complex protein LldE